jgi:capsular exopolysaccharide synthesis family protein
VADGVVNLSRRAFGQAKPPRALVDPTGAAAEPFRTLRLALQIRADNRTGNTILFTSAEEGAGKSTVASGYALVASMGQNVLLIDADLRRPALHRFFGVDQAPGLVDVLASGQTANDLARHVGPGDLRLLPAGSSIGRVGEVASSSRMRDLLLGSAEEHDLVVLDAPPVLASADAESLAAYRGVEVVLVVTPLTKRRMILKAVRRLSLIEAHLAGIVVNRAGRMMTYGR